MHACIMNVQEIGICCLNSTYLSNEPVLIYTQSVVTYAGEFIYPARPKPKQGLKRKPYI